MIGDRYCPKCWGSGLVRTPNGSRYEITVCDLSPSDENLAPKGIIAQPKPAIKSPRL